MFCACGHLDWQHLKSFQHDWFCFHDGILCALIVHLYFKSHICSRHFAACQKWPITSWTLTVDGPQTVLMNTYCGWTSNWTMLDGSSSLDFTGLIQNSGMNTRRCGSPFQYKGYFGMARFHNGLQMKIWNLLKLHWSSKQGKYILQDKYMSIKYDINIWHS